jgi:hypothetical protein
MKVKDLREELKNYDDELEVVLGDYQTLNLNPVCELHSVETNEGKSLIVLLADNNILGNARKLKIKK